VAASGPEKTERKSAPLFAAKFELRPLGAAAVELSPMEKLYVAIPGPSVASALDAKAICVIVIGPGKALLE